MKVVRKALTSSSIKPDAPSLAGNFWTFLFPWSC